MKEFIPASLLDRLKTQHLSLTTIISHLNEEQVTYKPFPEKWGIRENLAHLARYQKLFIDRIDEILSSDLPNFLAYKAENDLQFENWLKKNPDILLSEIEADRRILICRFECLTENDLQRVGVHSTYGKMNLLDWLEFFLLHEGHHLYTIFKLAHKK